MSVIYKYPLSAASLVNWITVPPKSKIISAIEQNGSIVVYAHVPNPNAPVLEHKRILVLGTGHTFNDEREYDIEPFSETRFINTVKVGPFVWHVFELMGRRKFVKGS